MAKTKKKVWVVPKRTVWLNKGGKVPTGGYKVSAVEDKIYRNIEGSIGTKSQMISGLNRDKLGKNLVIKDSKKKLKELNMFKLQAEREALKKKISIADRDKEHIEVAKKKVRGLKLI